MSETYTPDNLLGGHVAKIVDDSVTVASGQGVLQRGSLLGLVTATKKAKLLDKAAADGSQNVYAVLAETVDTAGGDVQATVYLSGEFNENALVVAAGNTVAEHKTAARNVGIYFKATVRA